MTRSLFSSPVDVQGEFYSHQLGRVGFFPGLNRVGAAISSDIN